MSLSTLRPSSAPRTPRQRVYDRLEQYFNITAIRVCSSSTRFLPSPVADEPTNNYPAAPEHSQVPDEEFTST